MEGKGRVDKTRNERRLRTVWCGTLGDFPTYSEMLFVMKPRAGVEPAYQMIATVSSLSVRQD